MAAGATSPTRNPVDKAFRLLACLIDQYEDGVGVRDLARATQTAPATTHRALADLEAIGLVVSDQDSKLYRVGPELVRLAAKLVATTPYASSAEPVLKELTDATGETSYLCMFDHRSLRFMFVASVPSVQEIRHVVPMNEWLDLDQAASGLAIYASVDAALIERAARSIEEQEGAAARAAWVDEVSQTAQRGYARTVGRRVEGAISIAQAVHSPLWTFSVGITAPSSRIDERREPATIAAVNAASERLAEAWSYGGRSSAVAG